MQQSRIFEVKCFEATASCSQSSGKRKRERSAFKRSIPMSSPVSSIGEGKRAASRWCTTEFYESQIYFSWKIKNFLLCTKNTGEFLQSSTFAAANNKSQWCLKIYPKGCSNECEEYMSLFLELISCEEDYLMARYKFYFYDKDMQRKKGFTDTILRKFIRGTAFGSKKFEKRNYLLDGGNGLFYSSTLRIGCKVYIRDSILTSGVAALQPLEVAQCDLSSNLVNLFHSQKYCDVILNVNGRKFNCHKAILAARSPVFSAMFGHEMREKDQNEAFISDVHEEVMEVFLRYIYTGKVENLDKFASDLLVLSDKYDLPRLKLICQEHLLSMLSIETALDILCLADQHNAERLRKCAITYFVSHAKAIMSRPEWEHISKERPDLLKELFEASIADRPPNSLS